MGWLSIGLGKLLKSTNTLVPTASVPILGGSTTTLAGAVAVAVGGTAVGVRVAVGVEVRVGVAVGPPLPPMVSRKSSNATSWVLERMVIEVTGLVQPVVRVRGMLPEVVMLTSGLPALERIIVLLFCELTRKLF